MNCAWAYVNACNEFPDDNYFGEWTVDESGTPLGFCENIHTEIRSPLASLPSISGGNDLLATLTVSFPECIASF